MSKDKKEKTEREVEMEFNRHGLNLKQETFCNFYIDVDREMFGNGFQCYVEAYNPDMSKPNWHKSAMASASRLLSNVKIINRINGLLEKGGFTDENVSKQHLFLLNQHTDLKTKMKAISDYYKLKGKYLPDKLDLGGVSLDVLEKLTKSILGIKDDRDKESNASVGSDKV